MIDMEFRSGWKELEKISSTLENLVSEVQQAALSEARNKLQSEWEELQDIISIRYNITLYGIS